MKNELYFSGGKACQGRNGIPKCAASTNKRNNVWVVGGDDYLSVWILDTGTNRLRTEKANLKKIKRDILTVKVSYYMLSTRYSIVRSCCRSDIEFHLNFMGNPRWIVKTSLHTVEPEQEM